MGLINETNAQYYNGEQYFDFDTISSVTASEIQVTLDTKLYDQNTLPNYLVYYNNTQTTLKNGGTWNLIDANDLSVNDTNNITISTGVPFGIGYSNTPSAGGTGYPVSSTITNVAIVDPGGVGTGMEATITTDAGGIVTNVVITKAGSLYPVGPGLIISGGNNDALIVLTQYLPYGQIKVALQPQSLWDNYGSYSYITLNDIVDNFMVGYVGSEKLIKRVRRSDVIFHAKRGLQEFSYDTLKSIKSQELTIPPSLSIPLPQDYVNYVQLSWVDKYGVKHIIYPTQLTSNPTQPLLQDQVGMPIQDGYEDNIETESVTDDRWRVNNTDNLNGVLDAQSYNANVYNWTWWNAAFGERYGLNPVDSNMNGWFTINEREGKFSFSSNLANKLITIEYISDGLAYEEDTKIPKMAEQALYMHILHAILSTRMGVQEYVIRRFKKERSAALRNAKIRLSNLKLDEFVQIMRGKSKWIKY